ncbi:MAG: endonuclease III [Gemmataceae bacterium]
MSQNPERRRVRRVRLALAKLYPETQTALNHQSPLQLLVATILSAQCTDARVNLVTPALFERFPDAKAFANAERAEIEELIKSTGFFRMKAKHIQECCRIIVEKFGGEVPGTLDELVQLPGIGRKTANVVLGDAFDTPGITVDTHVGRLSRRLGLSAHIDPVKVERDLMALIPQAEWTTFSHRLIFHGRRVCSARKPDCAGCTLAKFCPKMGVPAK